MNENVRKYREQILKIATDMSDWIKAETKDFPELYINSWRFTDRYLNWGAPLCPTIKGNGIVGAIDKYGQGFYIHRGRVYECSHKPLGTMDDDKDVTDIFLTNDKFCDYWTLVAGIEEIYRNWSSIKADVKEKKAQYNSVLSYNGL